MSHTPGPWGTDRNEHDEKYQDIKIRSGYRTIATVWIDDAPVPDFNHEQNANANLIAAAPDLLAACKALAEWAKGQRPFNEALDRLQGIVHQSRAAIAKAKGETNDQPG